MQHYGYVSMMKHTCLVRRGSIVITLPYTSISITIAIINWSSQKVATVEMDCNIPNHVHMMEIISYPIYPIYPLSLSLSLSLSLYSVSQACCLTMICSLLTTHLHLVFFIAVCPALPPLVQTATNQRWLKRSKNSSSSYPLLQGARWWAQGVESCRRRRWSVACAAIMGCCWSSFSARSALLDLSTSKPCHPSA